ncbi:MAG: prefoldin subunit [Candidatus Woesearchaeota archaeon]|nr:prefoldin subunit [Candidatus Woesearchaeota archaeon]
MTIEEIERALHTHVVQKQSYMAQLNEAESALHELTDEEEAYKLVGSIMLKADPAKLKEELQERKQSLTTRIASIEKQEQKLQQQLEKEQQALLGDA